MESTRAKAQNNFKLSGPILRRDLAPFYTAIDTLAEIAKTVASGAHALLILDGAGWHGSAELEVPDNITLLKLPPYSPELNPMENVWAYLRANKLAISVFDNYEQIVDRCCEAWNFFANDKTAITSITTRQWAKTVNG